MKFKNTLIFIFTLFSSLANSGEIIGRVVKSEVHLTNWNSLSYSQEGVFLIYIEGMPNACGSDYAGYARAAISTSNPVYQTVVSSVLSAKAREKEIRVVYLESCTVKVGAWDLAIISEQ